MDLGMVSLQTLDVELYTWPYSYVPDFLCHFLELLFRFSTQTLSPFAH